MKDEVGALHYVFYTQGVPSVTYIETHSGIGNFVPKGILLRLIAREDADFRSTFLE